MQVTTLCTFSKFESEHSKCVLSVLFFFIICYIVSMFYIYLVFESVDIIILNFNLDI